MCDRTSLGKAQVSTPPPLQTRLVRSQPISQRRCRVALPAFWTASGNSALLFLQREIEVEIFLAAGGIAQPVQIQHRSRPVLRLKVKEPVSRLALRNQLHGK